MFDAADPTAARQIDADDIPPPPPPGPPPPVDAPAAPASDHALVLDTKGLRISADPGQTTDVLERHAVEALQVGVEFGCVLGGRLWALVATVSVALVDEKIFKFRLSLEAHRIPPQLTLRSPHAHTIRYRLRNKL